MRKKKTKRCYNKMSIQRNIRILSLFANIGVAEARLNEIDGVEVVVANELVKRRAELYQRI